MNITGDSWENKIPGSKSSEHLSKEAFFAAKYYKNLRNMLVVGDTSAELIITLNKHLSSY